MPKVPHSFAATTLATMREGLPTYRRGWWQHCQQIEDLRPIGSAKRHPVLRWLRVKRPALHIKHSQTIATPRKKASGPP